jgi:hypothetical protein
MTRPYVYFVPGDFGRSGRFVSWDDGYFTHGGGVDVRNDQPATITTAIIPMSIAATGSRLKKNWSPWTSLPELLRAVGA